MAQRALSDLSYARAAETGSPSNTVKNAVELFFAFHPDVEKIQYH
jgi:hypothetical protein